MNIRSFKRPLGGFNLKIQRVIRNVEIKSKREQEIAIGRLYKEAWDKGIVALDAFESMVICKF